MTGYQGDKPSKIFAEVVEDGAMEQYVAVMNHPFVVQGALMPDTHTGYTAPIGSVFATIDAIFPEFVGYDIGCGMSAIRLDADKDEVLARADGLFQNIYRDIPVGFQKHKDPQRWDNHSLPHTPVAKEVYIDRDAGFQLGTLGGGNHFIEIGYDEHGAVWIVIHSGSRGLGHGLAKHYMKIAKDAGLDGALDINSEDGFNYITDLAYALQYALDNRSAMIAAVVEVMDRRLGGVSADSDSFINRNHNHAELKDGRWIHRKGATHAEKGMRGVIPGNMRDGSFIVKGKGDADSMCSSSHGAGRVLGRKAAKRSLDMSAFKATMEGVRAKVHADTLDESPFAYKNIFEVMEQQKDLVDVIHHVKPMINIKG